MRNGMGKKCKALLLVLVMIASMAMPITANAGVCYPACNQNNRGARLYFHHYQHVTNCNVVKDCEVVQEYALCEAYCSGCLYRNGEAVFAYGTPIHVKNHP